MVLTTPVGYGVANQVSLGTNSSGVQTRLRILYAAPVPYSFDVFPGFSDAVDEDYQNRVIVVVHGWHLSTFDVRSVGRVSLLL